MNLKKSKRPTFWNRVSILSRERKNIPYTILLKKEDIHQADSLNFCQHGAHNAIFYLC